MTATLPPLRGPVSADETDPRAAGCPREADFGPVEVLTPMVVRRCAIPVEELDLLAAPHTTEALAAAQRAHESALSAADLVTTLLYELIPRLREDRVRRSAIRLRRDVFNDRFADRTHADAERLIPELPADTVGSLHRWIRLQQTYRSRMTLAEDRLRAEAEVSGACLVAVFARPDRLPGLAVASPVLAGRLADGKVGDLALGGRSARSLASYLSRAAVKTSPFGQLATLTTARFGPRPADRRMNRAAEQPSATIALSRAVAVLVLHALAVNPATAGLLGDPVPVRVTHTGDGALAIRRAWTVEDAMLFTYVWVDVRRDIGLLTDADALRRLREKDPAALRRLLDLGLAAMRTPWCHDGTRHFAALADALNAGADGGPAAGACRRLAELEAGFAGAGAAQRARIDRQVRAEVRELVEEAGTPAPAWLDTVHLWHEAAESPGGEVRLPQSVQDDLVAVSHQRFQQAHLSVLYRRMAEAFEQRYGSGGRCDDVLGFLAQFLRGPRAAAHLSQAPLDDARTGAADQELHGGHGTLGPVTAVVYAQIAARQEPDLAAGNYRLVVNQINGGGWGVNARWLSLGSLGRELTDSLPRWLATAHPGCRLMQLSVGSEICDLQRASTSLLPALDWNGQPADAVAEPIASFTLHHDPYTRTLQLADRNGAPVALCYLGVVPAHLLSPLPRLLIMLGDPWSIPPVSPHSGGEGWAAAAGHSSASRGAADVRHRPRAETGRIVLHRAEWEMDSAQVPRPEPGQRLQAAHLLRLRDWFMARGIPCEGFARPQGGVFGASGKPVWFSLDHPHSVAAGLLPLLSRQPVIRVVEALPSREQHWATGPDGRHHAVELTAMTRVRPNAGGRR